MRFVMGNAGLVRSAQVRHLNADCIIGRVSGVGVFVGSGVWGVRSFWEELWRVVERTERYRDFFRYEVMA